MKQIRIENVDEKTTQKILSKIHIRHYMNTNFDVHVIYSKYLTGKNDFYYFSVKDINSYIKDKLYGPNCRNILEDITIIRFQRYIFMSPFDVVKCLENIKERKNRIFGPGHEALLKLFRYICYKYNYYRQNKENWKKSQKQKEIKDEHIDLFEYAQKYNNQEKDNSIDLIKQPPGLYLVVGDKYHKSSKSVLMRIGDVPNIVELRDFIKSVMCEDVIRNVLSKEYGTISCDNLTKKIVNELYKNFKIKKRKYKV